MEKKSNNAKSESESRKFKKPYHAPEMLIYGTVPEITQNVGTTSMVGDGGTMANNKTS